MMRFTVHMHARQQSELLQEPVCLSGRERWFVSEMFESPWGMYFDALTVVMLVVVTSVSALVHQQAVAGMSAWGEKTYSVSG